MRLLSLPKEQVGAFVIDERIGVPGFGIEPHQNVILVRSAHKEPVQWQCFAGRNTWLGSSGRELILS